MKEWLLGVLRGFLQALLDRFLSTQHTTTAANEAPEVALQREKDKNEGLQNVIDLRKEAATSNAAFDKRVTADPTVVYEHDPHERTAENGNLAPGDPGYRE